MECIRDAHRDHPRGPGMFNFPEFIIIGFQKAATTSLKNYLERHYSILKSGEKEPNFFTVACNNSPPEQCPKDASKDYIQRILRLNKYLEMNGTMAANEASTHIIREGHSLARPMAALMPWLKIVIQVREPISRAASMLIHNKEKKSLGCLSRKNLGYCLLHNSQLTESTPGDPPITYTDAVKPWIEAFPREQILVIQYESLVSEEEEENLLKVKKFLNIDPSSPSEGLKVLNARRFTINPTGWEMKKSEYKDLIKLVQPDINSLLDTLQENNLIQDKDSWRTKWNQVWENNLQSCDKSLCNITLS